MVHRRVGPEEVFRREGQDWPNRVASVRGELFAEAEKDSKADLRALGATEGSGVISAKAGGWIGAAEHGRVRRGDAYTGTLLRVFEERGQEWRRRAEGIDVDEIVSVRF